MKKENKIIMAAKAAKKDGYEYMTSVVRSKFRTTYHNVVKIDRVISTGKWIPAPFNHYGWHGRIGQINVPTKSINKTDAIRKYC